jgi:hypothetical protein
MNALLLTLHIAAGGVALVAAGVAIATAKGGRWHVRSGRIFALGMLVVFLTAVPMTIIRPNLFLFLVAVFSFYLVLTGWLRATNRSGVPTVADWVADRSTFAREDRAGQHGEAHDEQGRQRMLRRDRTRRHTDAAAGESSCLVPRERHDTEDEGKEPEHGCGGRQSLTPYARGHDRLRRGRRLRHAEHAVTEPDEPAAVSAGLGTRCR